MNFPKTLLVTLLPLLLLLLPATSTTLPTTTKPLRLIPACRPATLQRDALCACHVASKFGLTPPSFTARCARLFRANRRAMRRACNSYILRSRNGNRVQVRRLVRNLRFAVQRCPKILRSAGVRVGMAVSGRMLSNFQIRRRINRVLRIIKLLLERLQPLPVASNAPSRVVLMNEQQGRKVARLREYNDIPE